MSRDLEAGADAALQAEHVDEIVFLEFDFLSGTSRVCSREHSVEWNGFTWLGAGRVGTVEAVGEGGELEARGIAMTLSGLTGGLLAMVLTPAEYKGRAVRMWCGQIGEEAVQGGTAQAGASSSLTLAAGTTGTDNEHNGKILRLLTGAGSVQEREISDYDGSTKVATVSAGWRVNLLPYSEELDLWAGAATVTANAFNDPDGAATIDTLTDDDAGVFEPRSSGIVVPDDSATYIVSLLVRKDLAATQRCGLNIGLTGGGVVNINSRFALDGTNLASCTFVDQGNGFFLFSASIANNSSGNTALNVSIYPATSTTKGGGDLVAAVGSMSIGRVHVRRSTDSGDYIKTEAAAITLPDATTTYDLIHPRGIVADPIGPSTFKMDQLSFQLGSTATIRLTAESRLADWQRPRVRRYNNADHQVLHAGDKFFENVEKQVEAVHIW